MSDTNYRVGQILYIIPADNATVVPVQVMERRISETVEGTAIKHIVKTPKAKAAPLVLETVKGMIFADLQQARNVMIRNATGAIDSMVRHAHGIAAQVFAPKQLQSPQQVIADDGNPFDTSDILVDEDPIPTNGGAGHAMPVIEQQPPPMPDPEPSGAVDLGMTEVMGPDGRKQRVRLKMSR